MVTDTLIDLHYELEQSIALRVNSKLISYQVALFDNFYDKYTKFGIKFTLLVLS